ncbi:MAG: hypothetical protein KA715_07815 [Xanthomonadaceae bacterium]|nr:hypothetical protein [Xanthomonadaceae bacterium]
MKLSLITFLFLMPNITLAEEDKHTSKYQWEKKCSTAISMTPEDLMKQFKEFVQEKNEIPETPSQILSEFSNYLEIEDAKSLSKYFGSNKNISNFIDDTINKFPDAFQNVIDHRFFTQKKQDEMMKAIRSSGSIIMSKLGQGQDINDKVLQAALVMAKDLKAPLIFSPTFKELGSIPKKFAELFKMPNVFIMLEDIQYTKNVHWVDPGYHDKRVNPLEKDLMNLANFSPADKVIVFHNKVKLNSKPTGNFDTHPSYFMTTGSFNEPAYQGEFNMSMNTDYKAQKTAEKNQSAIVYSRLYYSPLISDVSGGAYGSAPRRVRLMRDNQEKPIGFADLGNVYTPEGKKKLKIIPGMVLGDIHLGITNPGSLKAVNELLKHMKIIEKNPKYGAFNEYEYTQGETQLGAIVLEDLVNGTPNSRYILESLISKAMSDREGALDLENHFQNAAAWMKQLLTMLPNTLIIVPEDNHGAEWLMKKLQSGDLFKNSKPKDLPLVLKLTYEAINEGVDPYKRIFQYYGINTDRVVFLKASDTYRLGIDPENPNPFSMVQGVDVSQHAQNGVNGAKGISVAQMRASFGVSMSGHTHATTEDGQGGRVGELLGRQGYQRGPSAANSSVGFIYDEETIQLLFQERGSFFPNADEPQDPEDFFPPGLPRFDERKSPLDGIKTTDQYNSKPVEGKSRSKNRVSRKK